MLIVMLLNKLWAMELAGVIVSTLLSSKITTGRIETRVWMKYSQEVASQPSKYKDVINVGEFDLRKKRSSLDKVNPFTIRYSHKSEEFAFLEENINRIKLRYNTIKNLLDGGRGKRYTFDDNLDYVEQLLKENDADNPLEGKFEKSEYDEVYGKKFRRAFRKKRSFYHDPRVKDEAYRKLKQDCGVKKSPCNQALLYFNSSVGSLRDDARKKVVEAILNDIASNFLLLVGIILAIVNFFMIRKRCRHFFIKNQNNVLADSKESIIEEGNLDETFVLPRTLKDVHHRNVPSDEDIKFIMRSIHLKNSKRLAQASREKPFIRKLLRIVVKKGLFF